MSSPEDAGSIYSDIRLRLDKTNADIAAVKSGFDKLSKDIQKNSNKTEEVVTDNFDKIKLSGVAAIGAITVAFKKSITVFAQTEQSLANVRAVSNATAEEFRVLEEAAADAGTTTRFTAGQAADALFFLSSAGLDAKESVAALDGVLTLAGATGSDLASTAQTVTATLSQFDLASEESTKVANIFAAANSNSQATLEKLSNALRQVGPVASGLNIGLEEVVGSLQALFNAGFQGESAGRALKSALADLANEASPTIEKLEDLGLSFEDLDPTVNGLTGTIATLEEAGLTTAQTIEAFGKVAGPQLVTLIKTGENALRDYEDAVTDTNEAARQYEVQNDTLLGSIDAFKSATEGAGNSLIANLAPTLRIIIDLFAGLLRFTTVIPDSLKGFGVGAAAAATGFVALSKALSLVGIALTGPVGLIAGIGALVVGFVNLNRVIEEKRIEQASEDFGDLARQLNLTGEAFDEFIDKASQVDQVLAFNYNLDDLVNSVNELSKELGLSKDEVIAIGLASEDVTDEYKNQLRELQSQVTEQRIINELSDSDLLVNEKITAQKIEQERLRAQELRDKEELSQREQERIDRLSAIQNEIGVLDELAQKGAISEIELLERKKDLRQEEIEILTDQAVTSGEVTTQVLKDIDTQQKSIDVYNKRLEELNVDEKARQEDQSKFLENEHRKREEGYDIYFNAVYGRQLASTTLFNEQEVSLTESLRENWQTYYDDISSLALTFYNGLVDLRAEEINNEIKEIERLKDAEIAAIDEATEAKLKSLGLQEETQIESLTRRLEEAQLANDQELASELQKELDREIILQEANDKKLALEEEAAKETAKLQYEADLAAWKARKINVAATGIQLAINAYNALAPIPYVGPGLGIAAAAAAATFTAQSLSSLEKAKPTAPKFQDGGIVLQQPGTSITGDQQVIRANPGEMILNDEQQRNLFDMINNGVSGNMSITAILEVDSRTLASTVAKPFNNGQVRLKLK